MPGDQVSETYTAASFGDKNVGSGKSVTVSGITLGGADAGNYTLASTTADTTADITPATLTVTITGEDKIYDGGTNASVTLADNSVPGDQVSETYAAASFGDKNVGSGKSVTVSGITLSGADAGNYTLARPRPLRRPISRRLPSRSRSPQPTRSTMAAMRPRPTPRWAMAWWAATT